MEGPRPHRLKRLLPYVQLPVLLILGAITVITILGHRRQLYEDATSEFESQLEDRVEAWEDSLMDRLDQWLVVATAGTSEPEVVQSQFRQREPWFDSLYLWSPPRKVPVRGKTHTLPAQLTFPRDPPAENTREINYRPCMARASMLAMAAAFDPEYVAEAYLVGCRHEALPVRVKATDDAAYLLRRAGASDLALQALDQAGLDAEVTMAEAQRSGLSPFRVAVHQLLRAQLLQDLGREAEALDAYHHIGLEITGLDAPAADQVLQSGYLDYPIIAQLQDHGRDEQVQQLERERARAERRRRAWREIDERILPFAGSESTDAGRFIYDQYAETPFVLYYGPVGEAGLGAALQLDSDWLVADFLGTVRRYRDWLVVRDTQGRVVGGETPEVVAIEVPFPRTLTHLRLGLDQTAVDTRVERLARGWLSLLLLVLVAVGFGLAAFVSQTRAARNHQELLLRQREFATRVTHELKTPLAGIRVMAENLEVGAWEDEASLRDLARRVVDETDRLTERVEQILAVTRRRRIPEPEVYDPEEPVFEAIDLWGPRLDQAGVQLHAELDATDTIKGEPNTLRDAVGCLLDNALKYRRTDRDDAQVWLEMRQEGRWVVVDVKDNGLGVPRNLRKAVFKRFVRVEGPNRGMAGGHGLGLAQVAAAVEDHGGKVECREGVDGGALFRMRLPTAS